MAKLQWGTKRFCSKCKMHYYDLKKPLPICPTCQKPFDPQAIAHVRRSSHPMATKDKKSQPPKLDNEELDTISTPFAEENDLLNEELTTEDIDDSAEENAEDIFIDPLDDEMTDLLKDNKNNTSES